jgi:hypothetical protein
LVNNTHQSFRLYARIAGAVYIVTIMLGIITVNFIGSTLTVSGNDAATLNNISADLPLFRIGIASEILMYLLVILLAFSLYSVLKTVDKNLALLALLFRMGEAVIGGATTVLSGLIPVLLLARKSVFEPGLLQTLFNLFLDIRGTGLDIVLIFIGVGGTIFSYLFLKSKFVPRILAVWGVLTYLMMFILSFMSIVIPISETTKMAFYAPGGLFELIFGFWLLIKSVNVHQWRDLPKEVPGSAR